MKQKDKFHTISILLQFSDLYFNFIKKFYFYKTGNKKRKMINIKSNILY